MPYHIEKRENKYVVINSDTGDVKAEHDTEAEAERQVRLLNALEHGMAAGHEGPGHHGG